MKISKSLLSLTTLFMLSSVIAAEVDVETEESRNFLTLHAGYYTAGEELDGASLNGYVFGSSFSRSVSSKVGAELAIYRVLDSSGNGLVTRFNTFLKYAVTGSLIESKQNVSLNNDDIISIKSQKIYGLRVHIITTQQFYNGTASAIPFGGFGLGASYDFSYENFIIGPQLNYSNIGDGVNTLNPIDVFFKVTMPL